MTISLFIINRIFFYLWPLHLFQILYITFLTAFLHIVIRVLTGEMIKKTCAKIKFNYSNIYLKEHKFEPYLYSFLHIKHIKNKMLTANPKSFDMRIQTFENIAHYMTVAEIVHLISIFASFIPCFLILIYNQPLVFIITSLVCSIIDLIYVFIQRYNRPRLLKLMQKKVIL